MKHALFAGLICVVIFTSHGYVAAAPVSDYAITNTFTFGFWSTITGKYVGFEDLLRDMRRHSMNCLVAGPRLGTGTDAIEKLKRDVALCHRYGIYGVISTDAATGFDAEALRMAATALKDDPMVLGWYIKDEPDPNFLPIFLERKTLLEEVSPGQPAVCLFYRPDSAELFSKYQPLILTDCYPLTYMHDGTSIGPYFANLTGSVLAKDLQRFNMWGNMGVLEWMDLCRVLTSLPHWVTLQAFGGGNDHMVRWREPTTPEIRLQTYLAIAGGAKGINYFYYMPITDDYGNALPGVHGENAPLLGEIGRLGAELTPMGPLFIDAEVAEPATVIAELRPTPERGKGVETRRLHSKTRNIDYIIAFNKDVVVRSRAQINLSKSFLQGRNVYDMHTLGVVATEDWPGNITLSVELDPGEGKIICLASAEDFKNCEQIVLKGRCMNMASILDMDFELAQKSKVDVAEVISLRQKYQEQIDAENYPNALSIIYQYDSALKRAMRVDTEFAAVEKDIAYIKNMLGAMKVTGRIGDLYLRYHDYFMAGDARVIRSQVETFRNMVEKIELVSRQKNELPDLTIYDKTISELDQALQPESSN
jgi:hypothetical protein